MASLGKIGSGFSHAAVFEQPVAANSSDLGSAGLRGQGGQTMVTSVVAAESHSYNRMEGGKNMIRGSETPLTHRPEEPRFRQFKFYQRAAASPAAPRLLYGRDFNADA